MIKSLMMRTFFVMVVVCATTSLVARDRGEEGQTPKIISHPTASSNSWNSYINPIIKWGPTALFVGGATAYTMFVDRQAPMKLLNLVKNHFFSGFKNHPEKLITHSGLLLATCMASKYYGFNKPVSRTCEGFVGYVTTKK